MGVNQEGIFCFVTLAQEDRDNFCLCEVTVGKVFNISYEQKWEKTPTAKTPLIFAALIQIDLSSAWTRSSATPGIPPGPVVERSVEGMSQRGWMCRLISECAHIFMLEDLCNTSPGIRCCCWLFCCKKSVVSTSPGPLLITDDIYVWLNFKQFWPSYFFFFNLRGLVFFGEWVEEELFFQSFQESPKGAASLQRPSYLL